MVSSQRLKIFMMMVTTMIQEWHSLQAWTPSSSTSAKRRGSRGRRRPESSSPLFVATTTTTTPTTTTSTTTRTVPVEYQESIMDPIPMEKSPTVYSSDDPAIELVAMSSSSRAVQYVSILWHDFIRPVMLGYWKYPPVQLFDWNDFWDMPVVDADIRTGATTVTASLHQNNTTTTTKSTRTAAQQFTMALEHLGPTFVKFGQALSARPDIVPRSLALALSKLQDQMETAGTILDHRQGVSELLQQELWTKKNNNNDSAGSQLDEFFPTQEYFTDFLDSLSENPVAAASIGVVYSATLPATSNRPTPTKVAIKLQRPGIASLVQQDARLLHKGAQLLESLPALPTIPPSSSKSTTLSTKNRHRRRRLIETDLTGAVNEFMSRIVEELDYHNEANNIETFANLYSHRRRRAIDNTKEKNRNGSMTNNIHVVVPQVYKELCTDKVLVMEWIEGTKLADLQRDQDASPQDTLKLVQQGIDCTLSQLLDTGVLHADPHGGNLIKVIQSDDNDDDNRQDGFKESTSIPYRLGYIDFGLLSTIPSSVQDGLVCAVAQLVFARNVSAIADLFGDLQLLPQEVVSNPSEQAALANELNEALSMILVYDNDDDDADRGLTSQEDSSSTIPTLRFDKLLDVLTRLVPRFQFQLPPYFLNNARALSTLEGMARQADPTFNVLQSLYPYAIQRLLINPSQSPVVEATLNSLVESPLTGKLNRSKMRRLVEDISRLSGYSNAKVLRDTLQSPNGLKLTKRFIREQTVRVAGKVVPGGSSLAKMTDYLRL